MALVLFGSAKGSPGTTTVASLVAALWPRGQAVLLEADPDGGVLAVRFGLGRDPGLASLASAARKAAHPNELWRHTQPLPGGLPVVVAPESADQVVRVLADTGESLGRWCGALPSVNVIADAGRLGPLSPSAHLARAADLAVVVSGSHADELYPAAQRVAALGQSCTATLLLVGPGPYGPEDVTAQLQVPVVGVVPYDRRAADVIAYGGNARAVRRSFLVRYCAALAGRIADWLAAPPAAPPVGLQPLSRNGNQPVSTAATPNPEAPR